MTKEKQVHANHRERVRNKFLKNGLDSFEDHEALEFLLYYSRPRVNVNPLAHELISHFGSLSAVFNADIASLKQIKGVGENSAILIKLVSKLGEKCKTSAKQTIAILSTEDATKFCKDLFSDFTNEEFYLICLNERQEICGKFLIEKGTKSFIDLQISDIIRKALNSFASKVLITHSHTGDSSYPSDEDIRFTTILYKTLVAINIDLLDHIIVSKNSQTSFAELNLLSTCKKCGLSDLDKNIKVNTKELTNPNYKIKTNN